MFPGLDTPSPPDDVILGADTAVDPIFSSPSYSPSSASSSISTAADATTAVRNAASALDASLFTGEGRCEPTGEYLSRAVTAARGERLREVVWLPLVKDRYYY